ncbi:IS1595 family transposase [bacterium]|nr:IS1595 family transposase [bacterium]NBX97707.1 IS1595 family transposase [bacterium]NDC94220.1 IS1595 family transposase [bacterium]NDD84916.1 IS1595 family transposase [bacterium]NDG29636.1 IS1595 family transposase [bacterium]
MKFTIQEFKQKFPTSDSCLDYLWKMHFADKPCTACGLYDGFHKLPNRPAYQCQCGCQLYPLAGTPFHKSTTDLRTWFLAIFFMTNTRSGMSALQFQRISGVTYKTAWRIFKQVRLMMAYDNTQLNTDVEVDEAYMHPNPQKRSSAKPHNSQVLFGMVERGGRARIKHVKSSGTRVLVPEIQKNIDQNATIYSDEYGSYRLLKKRGYLHETVNHGKQQYVVGWVHTQNVENFWSQFKRGIYGVYRHCDPIYLQHYANEYAFRYSNRKSDTPMFELILGKLLSSPIPQTK